jgi:hypothetical protein
MFASWYMMNGGERYAKLGKGHIARTGGTARKM